MPQKQITNPQLETIGIATGGTGQTTANAALNALLPSQTSQSGKVLGTDGTNTSWVTAGGGSSSNTYKEAVRIATTANITLSGNQAIDGVTTANGDRVLVKNQSTASQNGIYIADASSWTRATDFDTTGAEVANGAIIPVQFGTVNGGSCWQLVQNGGAIGNNFRFAPVNGVAAGGQAAWTTPIANSATSMAIGSGATTGTVANSLASGPANITVGPSLGITVPGQTVSIQDQNNVVVVSGITSPFTVGGQANFIAGYGTGGSGVGSIGSFNTIIGTLFGTFNNALGLTLIGLNATSATSYSGENSPGTNLSSAADNFTVVGTPSGPRLTSKCQWARAQAGASGITCQHSIYMLNGVTTSNTGVVLTTNRTGGTPSGFADRIGVLRASSVFFEADIVAREPATTDTKVWKAKGVIKNNAGTVSLVGTVSYEVIAQDTNASTWDVALTADDTNKCLLITVTGQTSKTIRWGCVVNSVMSMS